MESATVTIRISRAEAERLRRLADATKRSVSFLGHEAILRYLESEEWQVAAVQEAIAAIDAGEPLVEHDASRHGWRASDRLSRCRGRGERRVVPTRAPGPRRHLAVRRVR